MLVEAENKLFDGGGSRDGIEEFGVVVLVGLKVDELKELDEIGLVPNALRVESVCRVAELDETIGIDGKDDVCVTGGGDSVGVVTYKGPKRMNTPEPTRTSRYPHSHRWRKCYPRRHLHPTPSKIHR